MEEVIANYMGFTGMRDDCKTSDSYHRSPHDQGQKGVGEGARGGGGEVPW